MKLLFGLCETHYIVLFIQGFVLGTQNAKNQHFRIYVWFHCISKTYLREFIHAHKIQVLKINILKTFS